jgi:hypothetical protein
MLLPTVDAIRPVRGRRGPGRRRPAKVHADKGYDDKKLRAGLRKRGIVPRLARRNVESRERLGKYRWVAERTFSWEQGQGRLRLRRERRDDMYQAWVDLENAMICWGRLQGRFC